MNIDFLIKEINRKIDNVIDDLSLVDAKLMSLRILQYKIKISQQFKKDDYMALSILLDDYSKLLEGIKDEYKKYK